MRFVLFIGFAAENRCELWQRNNEPMRCRRTDWTETVGLIPFVFVETRELRLDLLTLDELIKLYYRIIIVYTKHKTCTYLIYVYTYLQYGYIRCINNVLLYAVAYTDFWIIWKLIFDKFYLKMFFFLLLFHYFRGGRGGGVTNPYHPGYATDCICLYYTILITHYG